MVFAFKLLITPILIGAATLAGRRWGPVANGLMVGLPLTTGPISFILAHDQGLAFASTAAAGNLAGQISMCVFCLVYSLAARKTGWSVSAVLSITGYLLSTILLNRLSWQLLPAFFTLLAVILLVSRLIPHRLSSASPPAPPRWDIPARIIIATSFVILITTFASVLGAQFSGLISTFPVFGVIFATFTHAQQGSHSAARLLRGIVFGSVSYAFFFLTVGLCLVPLGIGLAYAIALLVTMIVSGFFYLKTRSDATQIVFD